MIYSPMIDPKQKNHGAVACPFEWQDQRHRLRVSVSGRSEKNREDMNLASRGLEQTTEILRADVENKRICFQRDDICIPPRSREQKQHELAACIP